MNRWLFFFVKNESRRRDCGYLSAYGHGRNGGATERVQLRIVHVPIPQILKETAEMDRLVPQERVQPRTIEMETECVPLASKARNSTVVVQDEDGQSR